MAQNNTYEYQDFWNSTINQSTKQITQQEAEDALFNWLVDPKRNPLPEDYVFRQMGADTFSKVLLRFYNIMQQTSKSLTVSSDLKREVADRMLAEQKTKVQGYYGSQLQSLLESLNYMIEDARRKIAERKYPEGRNLIGAQEFQTAQTIPLDSLPLQTLKTAFSAQRYDFISSLIDRIASVPREQLGWSNGEWNEFRSWALAYFDAVAVGEFRRFLKLLQSYEETVRMLVEPAQQLDMSLPLAYVMKTKTLGQDFHQKLELDNLID
jgi:hypothetical protein